MYSKRLRSCDLYLQVGDVNVCDRNGIDPLKGLPFQPVVGECDCGSLDDSFHMISYERNHSFHMIGRTIECGGVMDEFVDHLGTHEESEAPLKQRFDALQRENESLKRRIDMLEQENQSLMRDQVWLASKPLHRRPY